MKSKKFWTVMGYIASAVYVAYSIMVLTTNRPIYALMFLCAAVLCCPLFWKWLWKYDKTIRIIVISLVVVIFMVATTSYNNERIETENKQEMNVAESTVETTTTPTETTVTTTETTITTKETTATTKATTKETKEEAETVKETSKYTSDTICKSIEIVLGQTFDNVKVTYLEDEKLYICTVSKDGLATAATSVINGLVDVSKWNEYVESVRTTCELLTDELNAIQTFDEPHVSIIVSNDINPENYLLLFTDGELIEDTVTIDMLAQ